MLETAFCLLVQEGPAALTPVRIHQESGVARTTIYRHWPTPADITESILGRAIARIDLDQLTGNVDHDLAVALDTLLSRFRNRPVCRFFDAVRLHGLTDESPTMSDRYIRGLMAPVRDVLTQALDGGAIEGELDDLLDEICGPLMLRHLLLEEPVDPELTGATIAAAFLARHRAD